MENNQHSQYTQAESDWSSCKDELSPFKQVLLANADNDKEVNSLIKIAADMDDFKDTRSEDGQSLSFYISNTMRWAADAKHGNYEISYQSSMDGLGRRIEQLAATGQSKECQEIIESLEHFAGVHDSELGRNFATCCKNALNVKSQSAEFSATSSNESSHSTSR